ncbi:HD domain-containing protein [Saliphagus sp. GCM10025308]
MNDVFERVRPVARTYFDDAVTPAHDWHHVRRVETNARRLAAERTDVDQDVLLLAAVLHDIGRPKEDAGAIDDHAEWGAREARTILESVDHPPESIDAVAHCIRAHRFSNDVDPRTAEARLLSDADNLDALGAIGLARTFSYGGELGTTIYDPGLPPAKDDTRAGATSVNHVHKKLLRLPERMYTPEGRAVAEERAQVVESFLETLEREVSGEDEVSGEPSNHDSSSEPLAQDSSEEQGDGA